MKKIICLNCPNGCNLSIEILADETITVSGNKCEKGIEFVNSFRFCSLKNKYLKLEYGGHAGLSETNWLLAFRPDLIDLSKVPKGELNVRSEESDKSVRRGKYQSSRPK